jgi:hypothetical protein
MCEGLRLAQPCLAGHQAGAFGNRVTFTLANQFGLGSSMTWSATTGECHKLGGRAEERLISGVEHIVDDQCPFFGQSLDGLELVDAFRKVFCAEYAKLKEHISVGQKVIEDRFSDLRVSLLDNRFESNAREAEFWRQYCELPQVERTHPGKGALCAGEV